MPLDMQLNCFPTKPDLRHVIWCNLILQGREAPRAVQGARSCCSSGIQAANLQAPQLQHSGHGA